MMMMIIIIFLHALRPLTCSAILALTAFALVFVEKLLLIAVNVQVLGYIVGHNLKLRHLRHLC
jgi:hypothetical protein